MCDRFATFGGEFVVGFVREALGIVLAHFVGDLVVDLGETLVENDNETGLDLVLRRGLDGGRSGWLAAGIAGASTSSEGEGDGCEGGGRAERRRLAEVTWVGDG